MRTKIILISLMLFVFMNSNVNCINYTVSLTNDDLIRILKEVCGSARYLISNAAANQLKAPYRPNIGKVLDIQCNDDPRTTTTTTTTKPTTTTTKPTTTKTTTTTTTTIQQRKTFLKWNL